MVALGGIGLLFFLANIHEAFSSFDMSETQSLDLYSVLI